MKAVRFCNPRFCHRCGVEIKNPKPQQKWCDDCHDAVKAMQQRQSVLRRKSKCNPVKSKLGDEEKKTPAFIQGCRLGRHIVWDTDGERPFFSSGTH